LKADFALSGRKFRQSVNGGEPMQRRRDVAAPRSAGATARIRRPGRGVPFAGTDGKSMHERRQHSASLIIPKPEEADRAVAGARRLFARTLACWASDMLALRRAGFNRPTWPAPFRGDDSWSQAA
jgi:hypothetical protein